MSADDDHKLLKAMRIAKSTPILILSSKTDQSHRIHTLQAGAHAYMGKPYTLEECVAQAHSLMQLYSEISPEGNLCYTLAFGNDLLIDPITRQVFVQGKELKMTRKEFDLLFCLASNPGKVFTREQLYDHIWDDQSIYNVDDVVKHHIKTLRKKLTVSNAEYIKMFGALDIDLNLKAKKTVSEGFLLITSSFLPLVRYFFLLKFG